MVGMEAEGGPARASGRRTLIPLISKARDQFTEEELVNLSLAVVAINGWNRLSIAFRPRSAPTSPRSIRPLRTSPARVRMHRPESQVGMYARGAAVGGWGRRVLVGGRPSELPLDPGIVLASQVQFLQSGHAIWLTCRDWGNSWPRRFDEA